MKAEFSQKVSNFERLFIGVVSILCGGIMIYLSIYGPFFLNDIKYKTSLSGLSQIKGQDLINLFLMAPLLIIGGLTHILDKKISKYLIILTPIYLIYYGLSMGLGIEWGLPNYSGNSENLTFHFLFLIISGVLLLIYSNALFSPSENVIFKRNHLILYSTVFVIFIVLFALMWVKEVLMVINKDVVVAYERTPALFWVIRYFDLGISIPLGLLSVYLLWTRPNSAFPIQLLFYGFFMTTLTAVCSMAVLMYFDKAPDFNLNGLLLFSTLAITVYVGFAFILSVFLKK